MDKEPNITKVVIVWLDFRNKKVIPYDKNAHGECVEKFLGWISESGELAILTGELSPIYGITQHIKVHNAACTIIDQIGESDILDKKPHIAGDCFMGKIIGWESEGYKVETPEYMRPVISEALGIPEIVRE